MTEEHDWFTVFRMDYDDEWLYKELRSGRMRQGWGAPGFALVDPENGKPVGKPAWEDAYKRLWGEPSTMRFAILNRMLAIEPDSIVVVPKMPHWDQFTIARVSGKYRFDLPEGKEDFGHVIPVDPHSVRTFHYRANKEAFLISGLFARAKHRPAVTFGYGKEHLAAAAELLGQSDDTLAAVTQKELSEAAIDHSFNAAAKALAEELKGWNGQRFEDAVRQAFLDQGYQLRDCPRHDGQGSDVDILVSPPASSGLFAPSEIAVQVKWKEGIDQGDKKAVQQIDDWAKWQSSNAAKYVISSASDFTPEAKEEARDRDVVLIGGLQTMCFLLGVPDRYRPDWEQDDDSQA